ncbi:hypothetical protein F0562_022359 [Nyssa sinensis]|uniref:Reverse transcriptase zinc-binding domain-containing protein n=1 Tax=Nyssa sinensis TaxID=561372 RepID=A0A5J5BMM6_9ASTE|nr:hypothetical protein F0562_022359 [Nyssa sinensis]
MEIGNGRRTSVWHDQWHPIGILKDVILENLQRGARPTTDMLVSSIIRHDEWRWTSKLDSVADLILITSERRKKRKEYQIRSAI